MKPTSTTPNSRDLVLRHQADGTLRATLGGRSAVVRATRCFPWSAPGRYISLRDDDRKEFALIRDPAELSDASRAVLEDALAAAGIILQVTSIANVDEEVEIRTWEVETRQGPRSFQTARDAWPRELPDGGFLIRDVAGDLYRVPSSEELDRRSQQFMWAFVDD